MQTTAIPKRDANMSLAYLVIAFLAFGIGAIAGLLQGLVRGGVIELPDWLNYYQILTAHGVLMALIFTTFFIIGFLYSGMSKTTGGLSNFSFNAGWIGWAMMFFGTAMATAAILLNDASVLYTFYAPLKATPWFYVGAALLVVGTWVAALGMLVNYAKWRKHNPGKISPLFAFMTVATLVLWLIATSGLAAMVLFQLIPWSFGWVADVNILLSRMLFWFFGHPLVYFWLMPAYIAWYVCIPKIIGGKVFSDSLARLAFILLVLFSIPVGFHHQLMEPGISEKWKFIHVILTLAVVVPSLLTAFSMFAVFETAGRRKGAKSLFGWFTKLPWKDVRFFAPMVGMLMFIPAGLGGIINASNQLNAVVHNTLWVVGHFHLTVATSVVLTFFGISYWLVPALTGRKLTKWVNRLGILQTLIWTVGMSFMSGAMHTVGLQGAPRRTDFTTYLDSVLGLSWMPYYKVMAFGGALLFIGGLLMIGLFLYMLCFAPKGQEEFPIAELGDNHEPTPRILERWRIWIAVSAVLILLAYGYPIYNVIQDPAPGAPPMRTW
ncbi:cytochrome c oxidase subunit 1 [Tumebacillus sp. BK434]|uniref:b(o/a)3-type cytochrome-c oxidase subunit 1 n=1 Tax=Tumebacillus sp. BK434 TaxID=2512169 RepID=UPI001045F25D|nr:b(o/a)3-type cytochrome-c oxidase subunit 1 [Tumebacillus sp. BK434]TCP58039.1 cytochrome c oxidase subunit 1 [Tumebacillus sp. BK434]